MLKQKAPAMETAGAPQYLAKETSFKELGCIALSQVNTIDFAQHLGTSDC